MKLQVAVSAFKAKATPFPAFWLGIVILIAVAIRLFVLRYFQVITGDGLALVSMAEDFVSGDFLTAGWGYHHQPLYPVLIALGSLLTHDFELSGQLISVAAGVLLIIPVYLLAKTMYGEQAAWMASLLTAFCPYLVRYSVDVVKGSTYVLLFTLVVYCGWVALVRGAPIWYFLFGLAAGAAFLTRFEGIGLIGLATVATLGSRVYNSQTTLRRVVLSLACLLCGFLLITTPHFLLVHHQTGLWTLGKKLAYYVTPLNVGELAHESNLELRSTRVFIRKHIEYAFEMYTQHLPKVFPPSLILVSGVGLFRGAWSLARLKKELYLAFFVLSYLIAVPLLLWPQPRYYLFALPVLCIWLAKGVIELQDWLLNTLRGLELPRAAHLAQLSVMKHAALGLVILTMLPMTFFPIFSSVVPIERKQVGLWMRDNLPPNPVIMTYRSQYVLYAEGVHVGVPKGDLSGILEHAREQGVDYFVVDERTTKDERPDLRFLLDEENAPEELELIYKHDVPGSRVLVYALRPRD